MIIARNGVKIAIHEMEATGAVYFPESPYF